MQQQRSHNQRQVDVLVDKQLESIVAPTLMQDFVDAFLIISGVCKVLCPFL